MHSCIDPPEKGNPGSWPGFQTESSHNNPSLVPQRNFTEIIGLDSSKVKPYPQQVVDKKEQGTTGGGNNYGIGLIYQANQRR